jgi:hypothetical protein
MRHFHWISTKKSQMIQYSISGALELSPIKMFNDTRGVQRL